MSRTIHAVITIGGDFGAVAAVLSCAVKSFVTMVRTSSARLSQVGRWKLERIVDINVGRIAAKSRISSAVLSG
jgi:hypothetical protein